MSLLLPPLIQRILKESEPNASRWTRSDRESVVQWLRRILVDAAAFEVHVDFLQSERTGTVGGERPSHLDLPEIPLLDFADQASLELEVVEQIARSGFTEIDNEQLVALLFNPLALEELSERIETVESDYWHQIEVETATAVLSEQVDASFPENGIHSTVNELAQHEANAQRERRLRDARQLMYRCEMESEAIEWFVRQPREIVEGALAELRRSVQHMRTLEGRGFLQEDAKFHLILARYAPFGQRRLLKQLILPIIIHGAESIQEPSVRDAICDEHEAIVTALADQNGEAAAQLLARHLTLARDRWCPGMIKQIRQHNAQFFKRMEEGHALIFCSLNVSPIEYADEDLQRELADSVCRGVDFVYLRPGKHVLRSLRKQVDGLPIYHTLRIEFKRFRRRIMELIANVQRGEFVPHSIRHLVRQRVVQLYLPESIPFMIADQAVGYYRGLSGSGIFTQRLPITAEKIWPEITVVPTSRWQRAIQQFLVHVKTSLRSLLKQRKQDYRGQRNLARRFYRLWFSDPGKAKPTRQDDSRPS